MKRIKMILFSQTGNTMRVGERIAEKLTSAGFQVDIARLEPKERLNFKADVASTKEIPSVDGYDVILLGTPVHGGRMSAPMRYFLEQTPSLQKIPYILFLTHFFRRGWGVIQTIQELRKLCDGKGGKFLHATDVQWFSLFRKQAILQAAEEINTQLTVIR